MAIILLSLVVSLQINTPTKMFSCVCIKGDFNDHYIAWHHCFRLLVYYLVCGGGELLSLSFAAEVAVFTSCVLQAHVNSLMSRHLNTKSEYKCQWLLWKLPIAAIMLHWQFQMLKKKKKKKKLWGFFSRRVGEDIFGVVEYRWEL